MRTWQKFSLVFLGMFVIAMMGVYFLVSSVLVPDTVALHIIPRLEAIVKRPVAYSRIRVGMTGAVIIEDISIKPGNDAAEPPVFASREMVLRCRILPLLFGKIVVDRVVLLEPQIRLSRGPEGRFNVSTSGVLPEKNRDTAGGVLDTGSSKPVIILAVSHLVLQEGTVTFTDSMKRPAQPLETTLRRINAEISEFSALSPFPATLSAEIEADPPSTIRIKGMIDPVQKQVTAGIRLTGVEVSRVAPYFPDLPFSFTGGSCSLDIQFSANSSFDFSSHGTLLITEPVITAQETPAPHITEALADMAGRGEIDVNHRISYRSAGDVLTLEQCKLTMGKITLSIQGTVESVSTNPRCDMTVNTGQVSTQAVIDSLPADMQRVFANLSSGGTAEAGLSMKGHLKDADDLAVSGFLVMDSLSLQSEAPRRWDIKLAGKTELNNRDMFIPQLTATTGNSVIAVSGKAANCFAGPLTSQIRISSSSLDVEEVLACIAELRNLKQKLWDRESGGTGADKGLIEYKQVSVDVEATLDRVSYKTLGFSDLRASGRWSGDSFSLGSLQGVIGDGAFTASSHIKLGDGEPDYTCRLTGNHLPLAPFLESLAPGRKESISGSADLAVNLQGRGMTAVDAKRNLAGEGNFTIRDCRVSGVESLESLASFIRIDALHTLHFDESQGTFHVGDGAIRLQGSMRGKDVELYPKGTVGLDADLDLLLDMRLSPRLSDQVVDGVLSKYFRDDKGWTVLSLVVKGPSGEAVVMPASSTVKNISEMLVDILLKKEESSGEVRDDKKKALEDLLQRLMQKSREGAGEETLQSPPASEHRD